MQVFFILFSVHFAVYQYINSKCLYRTHVKIGQSGVADKCVKMYSFLILLRLFTARYKNEQREKSFDFPSMRKVRDSNPRNLIRVIRFTFNIEKISIRFPRHFLGITIPESQHNN